MRVAGMISFVLVLIAVVFGVYSLSASFGFQAGEIFSLLWPVAVGVTLLAFALLAVGRWSARMLNRDSEFESPPRDQPHE